MKPINALALKISLSTGLRISDVLSIKWRNIIGNMISVTSSKTHKDGTFLVDADTLTAIYKLCPLTGSNGYIFPGKGKCGHRTRQAVFIDMRQAATALKVLEHATPHSARKTFAVGMRKRGLTETQIQEALQHSARSTTKIYSRSDKLNLTPERLDELVDLICDRVTERLKKCEQ